VADLYIVLGVCKNVTSALDVRNSERILVTGASSRTSAFSFNADPLQRGGYQHPTCGAETMCRRPVCQRRLRLGETNRFDDLHIVEVYT
jgi:hypothetical protein